MNPPAFARSRGAMFAGIVAAAACLAVIYTTPRQAFWIVDCGHKALVTQRLLETGFRDLGFDYPAEALDPRGQFFPMADWALRCGDGFVSIFPAAYPALAAPFLAWLGPGGLRVARPSDVVVTTNPLLTQHLAPLWHRKRMLLVQTESQLTQLAGQLADHGVGEFVLLVPPSSPVVSGVSGIRCRPAGRQRGSRVHYHDLDLQECDDSSRTPAREG